jgi:hypothetical protein
MMTPLDVLFASAQPKRYGPYMRVTRTQYGVRFAVIDEDGEKGLYLTDDEFAELVAALTPKPDFTHCRQCGHVEIK